MPRAGATTVWESWEGTRAQGGIASLDHYSKGAVLEWVFRVMCGVRADGENHFVIAPRPGGHLTHASLRYDSVYGRIGSGWQRQADGTIVYTVTVPANCEARVCLPDGTDTTVCAGTHTFTTASVIDFPLPLKADLS